MPTRVAVKATVVQVAAGSNHTLLLTSFGQVYTFGSHKVSICVFMDLDNDISNISESKEN